MNSSESTKPISYLKAHTAEAVGSVAETRSPLIITQNGYAKAVLQDLKSYEETQESLALLKILAQSKLSTQRSKPKAVKQAFQRVRRRAAALKPSPPDGA